LEVGYKKKSEIGETQTIINPEKMKKGTAKEYIKKGGNYFKEKLWGEEYDMTPKAQTTAKTYGANGIAIKPESEMSEADRIMWAEIDRVNGEYNNKNG
jgi:hypothetical protein